MICSDVQVFKQVFKSWYKILTCISRAHYLLGWYELIKTNFKIKLCKCASDFKDSPLKNPFKRVSEIIYFTRAVIKKYLFLVKQKKYYPTWLATEKINFLAAEYRYIKKTDIWKYFFSIKIIISSVVPSEIITVTICKSQKQFFSNAALTAWETFSFPY